ncbi:MAG: hypothetical protein ACOH2L_11735 [Devosia sp.]
MPANATLDQPIAWHVEHAQSCGCRTMLARIKRALEARGIPLPRRRQD